MSKKVTALTDIEIKKQYNNGFIKLAPMVENLIVKFENDKTSLDIQQLQLATTYLIAEREFNENHIGELEQDLDKEKEKNKQWEDKLKEIIDKIDVADYYCLNEAEEDLRKLINYYR